MADEKKTKLSIVIRTVDQATAKIKAINDRLDAITKPFRDFKEQLGDLRSKSGLDDVVGGFKGVGSAIADILGKLLMVGGVAGAAVAGLLHLVDGFDELGDKADEIGVSVDFLAQMRYAAERSGAAVESLDGGLKTLSVNLGLARAGTGKLTSFLKLVSPALLKQLKAAKSNEEAFDLLVAAMDKIEDPAKRAAFAQRTLGDASLAPLLNRGAKGIKELRDRYFDLAGSQEGAVGEAGKVDDAMKDLKASTDGIKAALVQGLAPALKVIVERLRDWFTGHREDIAAWAKDIGERLPGAIAAVADWLGRAYDKVASFIESIGGLKTVGIALAAFIVGPLVSSIVSLGIALATTPVGWITAGLAAIAALVVLIIKKWGPIKEFFADLWDGIKGVFQSAWDFIKGIVDKVLEAVDMVKDAVGALGGSSMTPDEIRAQLQRQGSVSAQASNALGAGRSSTEARVVVDFANAPRGTRVRTDPQSTADVDLSMGYQMGFAP